jgi:uncharacterized tellurite resistance protein B-like protein
MADKTAYNNLKGLLEGIAADGRISSNEFQALKSWCQTHQQLAEEKKVFGLFHKKILKIVSDGKVTSEEIGEMKQILNKYEYYFNLSVDLKADLHFLQGICYGIMADGDINKYELHMLKQWLSDNAPIRTTKPFDEIYGIIESVLEDGKIDDKEYKKLQTYFKEFIKLE